MLSVWQVYRSFSQKFWRIFAIWARVAVPEGLRVVSEVFPQRRPGKTGTAKKNASEASEAFKILRIQLSRANPVIRKAISFPRRFMDRLTSTVTATPRQKPRMPVRFPGPFRAAATA